MHIFHLDYGLPQGPIAFSSPQWLAMCQFAAEEAGRLGFQLGTHNCGGWSTSGGPWTRPENSMQVVVTREVRVQGPAQFNTVLPRPASYLPPPETSDYRDIAVLAYPTPDNELITMVAATPQAIVSTGKGPSNPRSWAIS